MLFIHVITIYWASTKCQALGDTIVDKTGQDVGPYGTQHSCGESRQKQMDQLEEIQEGDTGCGDGSEQERGLRRPGDQGGVQF